MKKTVLKPEGVHAPFSSYSHGIVVEGAGRIVFCAGQVAGDADGNIVGVGDFEAQGAQVIANMRAVLAEAGATFADVVKLTTYVVGQDNAQKGRDLVGRHFSAPPPANTLCVLAGLAHPDFLVEIEATAVLP